MNYRERFMNTMLFKDVHAVPFHEVGLWGQTLERWEKEGLPKGVVANLIFLEGNEYFGFEPKEFVKINSTGPVPEFEYRVLEEDDRIIVYSNTMGVTHKALKEGTAYGMRHCMDQYISFPVKDRDTFKAIKKRYEATINDRYPSNWDELVRRWKSRSFPLVLLDNGQFGFDSMLWTCMGTVGVSYIFYDDQDLVRGMLDLMADYIIELTHKA
ncbi:MAG: hypothetical protein Q7J78_02350, partial [Clostridiales bacterium]|nr:hypothetical protein [Clostridiales bacterium]